MKSGVNSTLKQYGQRKLARLSQRLRTLFVSYRSSSQHP
jgi:hypothetical protein